MISLEQFLMVVGISAAADAPVETYTVNEEFNVVQQTQRYNIDQEQLTCLADNIYFEANSRKRTNNNLDLRCSEN